MKVLLLCTLVLGVTDAMAVNKCVGPDGKTSYQEAPCSNAGSARTLVIRQQGEPAAPTPSVSGGSANGGASAGVKPQTEAERLEGLIAASQRDRRKSSLENRLIPDAIAAQRNSRYQCDLELAALRNRKSSAMNNLAGATWEQAISGEMNAVSSRCDTSSREISQRLDALRRECTALQCTDPSM